MIVAASWTANFTTWSHFANWVNNSNLAGLVMGIVLPGALLVAWHLRATRRIHDRTIAELKEHIDRAHREHEEREHALAHEQGGSAGISGGPVPGTAAPGGPAPDAPPSAI